MRYPVLALFLFSAVCSFGEEKAKQDPIDRAMEAAMDKDPSTAGMIQAISAANVQWDKRMNSSYNSLKKRMDPEEWKSLVSAQKA
jgi:uncharacterized protein YecT (DUF1311 family)